MAQLEEYGWERSSIPPARPQNLALIPGSERLKDRDLIYSGQRFREMITWDGLRYDLDEWA